MKTDWTTYNRTKLMWRLDQAGPGHMMEIKVGPDTMPWKYQMRVVEKEGHKGQAISNDKWDSVLFHAMRTEGHTFIMLDNFNFFIAVDPSEALRQVGRILDFEIVGRMAPTGRAAKSGVKTDWKNSGLYFYRFGELLTVDVAGLALYLYGEINPYTIGKAYAWNNQNSYELAWVSGEHIPFNTQDFTAAGSHYSPKGDIRGAAFYHRTLGLLNGLEDIKEQFPNVTVGEVRELYRQFGLTPSTHIREILERSGKRPKRKRARKSVGMDYDYFISKYHLYDRDGEMNFENSTDSMVMTSAKKLCEELREQGETITQNQATELWRVVMEG